MTRTALHPNTISPAPLASTASLAPSSIGTMTISTVKGPNVGSDSSVVQRRCMLTFTR